VATLHDLRDRLFPESGVFAFLIITAATAEMGDRQVA
jgi:hypothetical protein